MTHIEEISVLSRKLVDRILTVPSANDQVRRRAHDRALKGLRDQRHAQTNQFQVRASCDGLAEKFTVRNRDDLADALRLKLDQLPAQSPWLTECLALLLSLADSSLDQTIGRDVPADLVPVLEPSALTWSEILKDDPLDDQILWNDPLQDDASSLTSERPDDALSGAGSVGTTLTDQSEDANLANNLCEFLRRPDLSLLVEAKRFHDDVRNRDKSGRGHTISELSLVVELLNILRGQQTRFFTIDAFSLEVLQVAALTLAGTSEIVCDDLINHFVTLANHVWRVRAWVARDHTPYEHALQDVLAGLLNEFSRRMSTLASSFRLTAPHSVTSVIRLQHEVECAAMVLVRLSQLLSSDSARTQEHACTLSDTLFKGICQAQLDAHPELVRQLVRCCAASLTKPLRDIARWVCCGTVDETENSNLFTLEPGTSSNRNSTRYIEMNVSIRRNNSGDTCWPECLEPFADEILSKGRTAALYSILASELVDDVETARIANMVTTFWSDLVRCLDNMPMSPFANLFAQCFSTWIGLVLSGPSHNLGRMIFDDYQFSKRLECVPYLYFAKDGSSFAEFARILSRRLRQSSGAPDQFWSTELLQDILGHKIGAIGNEITLVSDTGDNISKRTTSVIALLARVTVRYQVPWFVQVATGVDQYRVHARIFTIMLQISAARENLEACYNCFRHERGQLQGLTLPQQIMLRLYVKLNSFIYTVHSHIVSCAFSHHARMTINMQSASGIDSMIAAWSEYETALLSTSFVDIDVKSIHRNITEILTITESMRDWFTVNSERGYDDSSRLTLSRGIEENFEHALSQIKTDLHAKNRAISNEMLMDLESNL